MQSSTGNNRREPAHAGIEIREVTPSDAPEWVRMRATLWPTARDELTREVESFFLGQSTLVTTFVAVEPGGSLLGFLELGSRNIADGCDTSPVAYIEGWYVEERGRRTGVGRALVGAAEAWARHAGYREMASDTEAGNETSITAHGALGYERSPLIVCFRKSLGRTSE